MRKFFLLFVFALSFVFLAACTESQINIVQEAVTITVGETIQIDVETESEYGGVVAYSSDDPTVATVDSNGVITGVAPGVTIVSASVDLDIYTDYVLVQVLAPGDVSETYTVDDIYFDGNGDLIVLLASGVELNLGDQVGLDGREVVLRVAGGFIQWQYEGEAAWNDLIALTELTGAPGEDGEDAREVQFQVAGGFIQWQYVGDAAWMNLIDVTTLVGPVGPAGLDGQDGQDGEDGLEVVLQVAGGFIQWQYVGDATWNDLIEVASLIGPAGLDGQDGEDGLEVALQVAGGFIQWQYVGDATWTNLIEVASLIGPAGLDGQDGEDGLEVALQVAGGFIQWQYVGDAAWQNLVELATLTGPAGLDGQDGEDGREVTFRIDAGFIQWQYVGDAAWQNLVELATLTGPAGLDGQDGDDGREIVLQVAGGFIQWQYVGDVAWTNLIEVSTLVGEDGDDGQDGQDGFSAYETYMTYYPGYPGTDYDWINELVFGTLVLDVELELNGGMLPPGEVTNYTALKGEALTLPVPTMVGFLFQGWYSDITFDTEFIDGDYILADTTYYALFEPEPEALLTAITGTSNTVEVTFNVPIYWNGTKLSDVVFADDQEKLDFLMMITNDPDFNDTNMDPTLIDIVLTDQSITTTFNDDALRPLVFQAIDQAGNSDGIYRRDVELDVTGFTNKTGFAVQTVLDPFRVKFSVPFDGTPDYDAPVEAVFQTDAQWAADKLNDPDLVAPVATLTAITGDSNVLEVTFDKDTYLDGTLLSDVVFADDNEKLAFLQVLFNDPDLDLTVMDPDQVNIVLGAQSIVITINDNAIIPAVFLALDTAGNSDGVYRRAVELTVTDFTNRSGVAVEETFDPFKLKFSVPFDGVADYGQPIEAIFQTDAQRAVDYFTISFDSNGGSAVADMNVEQGLDILAPADPTLASYDFVGWYEDAGLTIPFVFDKMPSEDFTLYAEWTPTVYDVNYELDGGTNDPLNPATYTVLDAFVLEDASKTGYTFEGWYEDVALTIPVTEVVVGTSGDLTFYADFDTITYNITYVMNDSVDNPANNDPLNPATYTVEDAFSFEDADRIGYTFDGWHADAGLTTPITEITLGSTGDITVYADWVIIIYTITYEKNGGAGLNSTTAVYGAAISAPADPVLDYHDFDDWYEDAALTMPYVFDTMPAEDFTLYAGYEPTEYAITYDLDGGTNDPTNPASYTYFDTVVLGTPTRAGYIFDGWFEDAGFTTPTTGIALNSDGPVTFYASWTIITYDIDYELDGGTNDPLNPATYNALDAFLLEDATKLGYTFDGWFEDAALTVPVTEVTLGTSGDLIFYAGFTIITYTITYDLNDSIANPGNNDPLNPATYTVEDAFSFEDADRIGYDFNGWYEDSDLMVPITEITLGSTGDITVYADWIIVIYTITYEKNGGIGANSSTSIYGAAISAPADPVLDYYDFDDWYEDAALTTPFVFTTMPNYDFTLYAGYVPTEYTITYDLDGGTNDPANPAIYTVEDAFSYEEPSKVGYTFDAWYTDALLTTTTTGITLGSNGDITVYAGWIINTYDLVFEDYNGVVLQTTTYDFDADLSGATPPADPTRTGYTFNVWDQAIPANMPNNDVTITATYTINSYDLTFEDFDGSVLQTATYEYAEDLSGVTAPADPTRIGYTFNGWDAAIPANMPANDVTITATYIINTYDLIFEDHDGAVLQVTTHDYDEDLSGATPPVDPTRTGYTFDAWDALIPANMPNNDVTITATYTINSYDLTFEDFDGSVLQTATYDFNADLSAVTAPADPSRVGYTFDGWDTLIPANMPANDVTITALYSINSYLLIFEDHDGAVLQSTPYDFNEDLSGATAPADPTRTGYTFDAWDALIPANMPDSDVTITATYTITVYTITYELNDGGDASTDNTMNVTTYTIADEVILGSPTRVGYAFDGWFADAALTVPVTQIDLGSTGNVTFYAKWVVGEYSIFFDNNGGVGPLSITGPYNMLVIAPSDPVKDGYTFDGWYEDDGTFLVEYTFPVYMPSYDQTIHAKWVPIP